MTLRCRSQREVFSELKKSLHSPKPHRNPPPVPCNASILRTGLIMPFT